MITRGKRGVTLTQAGLVFLAEARLIVAHATQAIADAREAQRGMAGRLRISYSLGYLAPSLANVIKRFRERFPKIKIERSSNWTHASKWKGCCAIASISPMRGYAFTALQEQIHFECIHQARFTSLCPSGIDCWGEPKVALSRLSGQPFVSLGGVF